MPFLNIGIIKTQCNMATITTNLPARLIHFLLLKIKVALPSKTPELPDNSSVIWFI
jgi:hypothetical protein